MSKIKELIGYMPPENDDVYACVAVDGIGHYTGDGQWSLVAIVQNQQAERMVEQVANPIPDSANYQTYHTFTERTYSVLATKAMAVLRKSRDAALADAVKDAKISNQCVTDAAMKIEGLQKKLATAEKTLEERKALLHTEAVKANELRTALLERGNTLRKMEADLAKIRTAIGGLEMDKILGVEKK